MPQSTTPRLCSVDGCERKHYAKGYCGAHYQRLRIHGTVELPVREVKACSVEGCTGKHHAKDLCQPHYMHWLRVNPEYREATRNAYKERVESDPTYRERLNQHNRKSYAKHIEKRRASNRERWRKIPEKRRQYMKKWRDTHADQYHAYYNRNKRERRARDPEFRAREIASKRARGWSYRKVRNIRAILNRDGRICAECGEWLTAPFDGKQTHVDHKVPRSKGGSHALSNLQLLHASCNISKGARVV